MILFLQLFLWQNQDLAVVAINSLDTKILYRHLFLQILLKKKLVFLRKPLIKILFLILKISN